MNGARDIRPIAMKLARMALVFLLVFWSSLRVEYLVAYAAPNDPAEGEAAGATQAGDEDPDAGASDGAGEGAEGTDSTGGAVAEPGEPSVPSGPSAPVEAVKISAVEILDKNGAPFTEPQEENEPELVFATDELPVEYQLQAVVEAENASFSKYKFPENGKLSQFSQGALADLQWKVNRPSDRTVPVDPEIAQVDDKGVLKITEAGTYDVTCVAHVNATTEEMPAVITVVVSDAAPGEGGEDGEGGGAADPDGPATEADLQGASHPQDTLKVVSVGTFEATTAAPGVPTSGEPGSGIADEAGENQDGDEPLVNRTYTENELRQAGNLPKRTATFNITAQGKEVAVTGYGFDVMNLIESAFADAGLDVATANVESVDFIDYRGVATNVPWSYLKDASALLAFESRVELPQGASDPDAADASDVSANAGNADVAEPTSQPDSDDIGETSGAPGASDAQSGASASAEGDEAGLLPNTRFRLLSDFPASFDADSLRWINTIQINGQKPADTQLKVSIDYTPVPRGVDSEFVAVPSYDINGSWDCVWEISYDKGVTAEAVPGAYGQSLTVPTDDNTVGAYFRVTINNESGADEAGAPRVISATSNWVELTALDDRPSVVLSYNPPQAGDVAIFRSSIYGYKGDVTQLEYVWEWTEDGGESWNAVAGETKPTMKIPTEPVNDAASGDEGGDSSVEGNLIYIRVRAIPPQGDPMVSNVQPLTVRVGDEDNTPGGSDDDGTVHGEDEPSGDPDQETDPQRPDAPGAVPSANPTDVPPADPTSEPPTDTSSNPQQPQQPQQPQTAAETPYGVEEQVPDSSVTEIRNITLEYAPVAQEALDPDGSSTRPSTPQVSGDPSQLYINDEVTELVREQERAAEEQVAITTPGARWTALNTLDPNADDVSRVLDGNPFAPLVIPFSLGITAAGGVEKLLFFRRQTQ